MYATNWNKPETIHNMLWRQNIAQMWVDTEFKPSRDTQSWAELTPEERETYKKTLAGLTGLDTLQGDVGMVLLQINTDNDKKRAVMSFMAMMEHIHAKSYSTIFTTLLPPSETDYLLEVYPKEQPHLVYKADVIGSYYSRIIPTVVESRPVPYTERSQVELLDSYLARVASVYLESFLFYSGFYYPLLLKGHGKMVASGEIIRKIMIDESIHGVEVGLDAQDIYRHLNERYRGFADEESIKLLEQLYDNEAEYTKEIYGALGEELTEDVLSFVRYNANKALSNLGRPPHYPATEFNPIVLNALDTSTGNHDFFSVKGDGYEQPRNQTPLEDDDFNFDNV